ncbi:ThuA domain-containing protein [Isoptericola sp. b490]|uniref:ThuA domain-containing protein n=1 Tax=Actinotalea lenta TaxID=3064654 RepID=UPI002712DAE9|nr:ThuA domain-containing protein [Isoptericola sp. b490]MDO8121543.1 ThuA domain-containing protein [Isoptericola sp. b490]
MDVRALVLCGGGRRSDPWHDLAATGHAVALVLAEQGVHTRLSSRPADVMAPLDTDLLVVNCSDGEGPTEGDVDGPTVDAAIGAHVAAGRPILALHSAALAFPDAPGWARVLGARWVHGRSMHPELGRATVRTLPSPITDTLADVEVTDERYCFLEPVTDLGAVVPHVEHRHEGVTHPLAWARTVGPAGSRVVYDALGHDVRSYASPTRRALLAAELGWLLGSAGSVPRRRT